MISTRRILGPILALVLALGSTPALATYACTGPVTSVLVNSHGTVSAGTAGGLAWVYFCRLGETINGVSSEACKGILAVLLSAQATGKHVQIWFDDALSCSTRPSWVWLTGWYWGPAMLD